MQQKLVDTMEANLDLVEKEITAEFQQRKLPAEELRDETYILLGKVVAFTFVHMGFNRFWKVDRVPSVVAAVSRKRMALLTVMSIPLSFLAVAMYVKIGDQLGKNSFERKANSQLQREKDIKLTADAQRKAVTFNTSQLTSFPEQSDTLHFLATQNVFEMEPDPSIVSSSAEDSLFDVYLERPQVWPCAHLHEPITLQRVSLLAGLKPLGNEILFRAMLLRSLLSYVNPLAAHVLTACSYMLTQDTEADLAGVMQGLSFADSAALNIASSLFSQGLFVFSGGIATSVLFQSMSNCYYLWQEFKQMDNANHLREQQPATLTIVDAAAHLLLAKYKKFVDHLERRRAQLAVNPTLKSRDTLQDLALDAQCQALPEVRRLAEGVMRIYSTDHYAGDLSSQRLLYEDCVDFLSAFDVAVDEWALDRHRQQSQAATHDVRVNDKSWVKYFGRVNQAVLRVIFCNDSEAFKTDEKNSNSNNTTGRPQYDDLMLHMFDTLDHRIRRQVLHAICEKDGGLTRSQLEDLLVYVLSNLNVSGGILLTSSDSFKRGSTDSKSRPILPLSASEVEDILSRLSRWEDCSSDEFLDLIQSYYSAFLLAEEQHMQSAKPSVDRRVEQTLAGRRPSAIEFINRNEELKSILEVYKDRWTIGYLLRQGSGLTSRRFATLFDQKAVHDPAVQTLKDQWMEYFAGSLYMKRKVGQFETNSRGEVIRVHDEMKLAQQFRLRQQQQAETNNGTGWWGW
eukprot:gene21973-28055_t